MWFICLLVEMSTNGCKLCNEIFVKKKCGSRLMWNRRLFASPLREVQPKTTGFDAARELHDYQVYIEMTSFIIYLLLYRFTIRFS